MSRSPSSRGRRSSCPPSRSSCAGSTRGARAAGRRCLGAHASVRGQGRTRAPSEGRDSLSPGRPTGDVAIARASVAAAPRRGFGVSRPSDGPDRPRSATAAGGALRARVPSPQPLPAGINASCSLSLFGAVCLGYGSRRAAVRAANTSRRSISDLHVRRRKRRGSRHGGRCQCEVARNSRSQPRDRLIEVIAIETKSGEAVQHGDWLLVPISRSLTIRLPAVSGGLVWNRPLGLLVERSGERRFIPIRDRTRQFQWFLLGAGVAAALVCGIIRRRNRRVWR